MNKEHEKFMASIADLKLRGDLTVYIVERSDVSTVIVSTSYADGGWLISHNAWYLQEVWVIDLTKPEQGKQYYSDVKDVQFNR